MIETMNCPEPSSRFDDSTKYISKVKKICSVHLYRPTPLLFRSWDGYKESKDSLVKPVQRSTFYCHIVVAQLLLFMFVLGTRLTVVSGVESFEEMVYCG